MLPCRSHITHSNAQNDHHHSIQFTGKCSIPPLHNLIHVGHLQCFVLLSIMHVISCLGTYPYCLSFHVYVPIHNVRHFMSTHLSIMHVISCLGTYPYCLSFHVYVPIYNVRHFMSTYLS